MKILITGSAGFIGSALCRHLSADYTIIGADTTKGADLSTDITWEQIDLTDLNAVSALCEKYSPEVVIHCAGIAHQKIGAVSTATYTQVNSEATENLARIAAENNPDVLFIFLSSVSVYGEDNVTGAVSEGHGCHPSSDYAASKLDAERRLAALCAAGVIRNVSVLRLAPVYDREWSLNLDRRVFAPGKLVYLRFGSGSQRMSALARPNLVAFIAHMLRSENCPKRQTVNVCDAKPYEFKAIIKAFRASGIRPNRLAIFIPLSTVWFATRMAGVFLPKKKKWIHSCYEKLATDLIFDNRNMLGTGFVPVYSLETIFQPADYMSVLQRRTQ